MFNLSSSENTSNREVKVFDNDFNKRVGRLFKAYKEKQGEDYIELQKGNLDIVGKIPDNEAISVQVAVADIYDKDSFDQSTTLSMKYNKESDSIDVDMRCPDFDDMIRESIKRADNIKIKEEGEDEKIIVERKLGGLLAIYNNVESTTFLFRKL